MDYELEKLKQEYNSLNLIWTKLENEWEKPSDFEDLYKIYPLLTVTAAIARKYIYWDKELNFNVSIVEPSLETEIDASDFLYYDEKSFFNGKNKDALLSQVASVFLHQREYVYMDNRKNDGKMRKDTNIYLYVKTDRLCKSCALANNGEYKENGQNFKKTIEHVEYSDCLCGYYVNMRSYLDAIKKLILKNE